MKIDRDSLGLGSRLCKLEECTTRVYKRGGRYRSRYCHSHRRRIEKYGDPRAGGPRRQEPKPQCGYCGEPTGRHAGSWLCDLHYGRMAKGQPIDLKPRESQWKPHPKSGYVRRSVGGKDVWQHREVMEAMLGRPLLPWPQETVHHKNGVRRDNRPENLELKIGNHGCGSTVPDRVTWLVEQLRLYAPELLRV